MFGQSYFGRSYFGGSYWGKGASVTPTTTTTQRRTRGGAKPNFATKVYPDFEPFDAQQNDDDMLVLMELFMKRPN